MTAALPAGSVPAMTSSMPASAATARAVASLSPVSRIGCSPSARSSATAAAAESLTVSATAIAPRAAPSQPTSTAVRPACSHRRHWPASSPSTAIPCSASSRARPMTISRPSTVPRAPSPGSARNAPARGSGPHSSLAAALIAVATECSEPSSTAPAYLSRSARATPPAACTPASSIRPVVTVPVLSRTTTSTARDDSSAWYSLTNIPLPAPRPDAATSAAGVARPSAHGHAMISTASPALNACSAGDPASSQPARVADGADEHRGHEHAADPVGHPLDRGLLRLGLLDQADQPGELGVAADVDRADDHAAGEHDGAAGHAVALGRLARHRLAGHHRAVDRGLAELDLAVGGDGLARPDDEPVARPQPGGGHPALGPAGLEQAHLARRGGREVAHRLARDAPGAGLVQPSGQQEGGDGGGGLEVDAAAGVVDQPLPEGAAGPAAVEREHRVDRPAAGCDDAERHQGVHRRRAVPGVLQRRPVKGPGAPQRHRRRAPDQQPLPAGKPQRRDQRQHHRQVGQRDEQHQRDDQPALEVSGVPRRRIHRAGPRRPASGSLAGAVAVYPARTTAAMSSSVASPVGAVTRAVPVA